MATKKEKGRITPPIPVRKYPMGSGDFSNRNSSSAQASPRQKIPNGKWRQQGSRCGAGEGRRVRKYPMGSGDRNPLKGPGEGPGPPVRKYPMGSGDTPREGWHSCTKAGQKIPNGKWRLMGGATPLFCFSISQKIPNGKWRQTSITSHFHLLFKSENTQWEVATREWRLPASRPRDSRIIPNGKWRHLPSIAEGDHVMLGRIIPNGKWASRFLETGRYKAVFFIPEQVYML